MVDCVMLMVLRITRRGWTQLRMLITMDKIVMIWVMSLWYLGSRGQLLELLSSPPARNRGVRPGERGVRADWAGSGSSNAWIGSSNAHQAWVAQIRCPARINGGESPWNHFLLGFSGLRDMSLIGLSLLWIRRWSTDLSYTDLFSCLNQRTEESHLEIILGPDSSWVCQIIWLR